MTTKVNLVVAMCNNRGIGIEGKLPWRIRGDMAFFKKITSETKNQDLKNAVIMGRKTWESIPEKFRPLPNRINIVISTTLSTLPSGVHLARSFNEAVMLLDSPDLSSTIEQAFVIGGASVYDSALSCPLCHRVYLTRVLADDIKCDTFMPELDANKFTKVSCPEVDDSLQTENQYEYRFEVYEKV